MQIRIAQKDDAEALAGIIRRANAPVAERFGLTPDTAPRHPSNCTPAWILGDMDRGAVYFIAMHREGAAGCIG